MFLRVSSLCARRSCPSVVSFRLPRRTLLKAISILESATISSIIKPSLCIRILFWLLEPSIRWGLTSSRRCRPTKLAPRNLCFTFPAYAAVGEAHPPRLHGRDTSLVLYADSYYIWVVFQTRPDIRVRVRCIVVRVRVRHTAVRIRVVVAAIDHTAYRGNPPFGAQSYSKLMRQPKISPTSRAYARIS